MKNSAPAQFPKARTPPQIPLPGSDSYLDDLLDRPISYQRCYAKLRIDGRKIGACAGLMLSQACYWSLRAKRENKGAIPERLRKRGGDWFWKKADEWEEETGLTTREQQTARGHLNRFAFWNEECCGVPAKLYYFLDRPLLRKELQIQFGENAKLDWRKSTARDGETPNKIGENAEHLSLSKTTTKNTHAPPSATRNERVRDGGGGPETPAAAPQRSLSFPGFDETAEAFAAIGHEEIFADRKFQKIWVTHYRAYQAQKNSGRWLTQEMEATIQECQKLNVGIPPQFYEAKRDVLKREEAEAAQLYHRTPL
jgi:hypothetical protein